MGAFAFLVADGNTAFAVAGAVLLLLLVTELVGLLTGLSPGGFLDELLPDSPGTGGHDGLLAASLAWLNAGRLPALVLLLLLLGGFASAGYLLQGLALGATGALADGWVMALPAAVLGGLAARYGGKLLARWLPGDQSAAIETESLIGSLARVTVGPATRDEPGRAVLHDHHGGLHNVRIRAARRGDSFPIGAEVLLAGIEEGLFAVMAPPGALAEGQRSVEAKGVGP